MNNLEANILDISRNYYKYLLSLENVNGIGMGYKWINNKTTLEHCIHVLVENKIHEKYISHNNIIPKTYMGIKTDVINVGKPKKLYGEVIPEKIRPLKGGCSIAAYNGDFHGTLGCIVTKIKEDQLQYYILSNNHVLSEEGELPLGTPIIQPSDFFGGTIKNDKVASLSNVVKLKYIEENKKPSNYVDCAIARLIDGIPISNEIIDIGKINGVANPIVNSNVKKVGFVTGLTEGSITSIGVTIEMDFNKPILFKEQIVANLDHSNGDSGSIVLNEDNKAIGILCAGSGKSIAYINDINIVLRLLKVKIYTD